MNEIKIFENQEFGKLRTTTIDNNPWFVAKDVCDALEIKNSRDAVARLDDDEKNTVVLNDGIGNPNKTVVNEAGLYTLVLSSRKPEAKQFKRWVTHDILPAIRKTGGYIYGEETLSDEELFARALAIAQNKIAERDKRIDQLEIQNSDLSVKVARNAPKAEYFDELVERNTLTSLRDTAKELGVKERKFIGWLLEKKYLFRDKKGKLTPTAGKGDGLFASKECLNDKTRWSGVQTMVTPKGRETFRLLYPREREDQIPDVRRMYRKAEG